MSADEQVELRGMQPRHVIDVLDAVSSSRRIPRNELLAEILRTRAAERIHEAQAIAAVTRRNPQATEATRKEAGSA